HPEQTNAMRKLLTFYVKWPMLLDLSIALILLPIFCHLIVSLHSKRTIDELFFMRAYWIPMVISYVCGIIVMVYIRWNNFKLIRRYGIDDNWERRAADQLRWNILPPVIFVILVIAAYFAFYGENILSR